MPKRINRALDMDFQASQARLDHYNRWLMDLSRPLDSVYPGYPKDQAKPSDEKSNEINRLAPRKKPVAIFGGSPDNVKTEAMKGRKMAKVTNLSRATEIVKAAASKAEALEKIVSVLGVSRSNAFVYFTKASKALGAAAAPKAPKVDKMAEVVAERAAKTARARKVNPVTETSPEKAKAKVAEIDAVIAGLRASGVKVASPFGQLGA